MAYAKRTPGEVSQLTQEISNEIFSPFCPGKTLDMCPSPSAAEVRRVIQDLAKEGKGREEIKQDILKTYGEEFRIVEPPARDNQALFAALFAGLLLAIGAVFALSKKRQGAADAFAQEDEVLSEEELVYLTQLREQLEDEGS